MQSLLLQCTFIYDSVAANVKKHVFHVVYHEFFLHIFYPFCLNLSNISLLFVDFQRLLASYIEARLRSLDELRGALLVEVQENTARGEALQVLVRERCLPVELERYNLFIGDLERVVSLLLCLSARLARVQNALATVDQNTDAEEKVGNQSF